MAARVAWTRAGLDPFQDSVCSECVNCAVDGLMRPRAVRQHVREHAVLRNYGRQPGAPIPVSGPYCLQGVTFVRRPGRVAFWVPARSVGGRLKCCSHWIGTWARRPCFVRCLCCRCKGSTSRGAFGGRAVSRRPVRCIRSSPQSDHGAGSPHRQIADALRSIGGCTWGSRAAGARLGGSRRRSRVGRTRPCPGARRHSWHADRGFTLIPCAAPAFCLYDVAVDPCPLFVRDSCSDR